MNATESLQSLYLIPCLRRTAGKSLGCRKLQRSILADSLVFDATTMP